MGLILFDGTVKVILDFSVIQHLCPVQLRLIPVYTSGIVLGFDDKNAVWIDNHVINLRGLARGDFQHKIVDNIFLLLLIDGIPSNYNPDNCFSDDTFYNRKSRCYQNRNEKHYRNIYHRNPQYRISRREFFCGLDFAVKTAILVGMTGVEPA